MKNIFFIFITLTFSLASLSVVAWEIPFQETLATTPDAFDLLATIKWVITSAVFIVSVFLLLASARCFSKEDYANGCLTFIASMIAGASILLARALV